MPNIRPVSELRNYGEVLHDVSYGNPVFLTKNGYGKYALVDIDEYREFEKFIAYRKLLSELERGKRAGETAGWLSANEVFDDLIKKYE